MRQALSALLLAATLLPCAPRSALAQAGEVLRRASESIVKIEAGIKRLLKSVSRHGAHNAAQAIMTSDSVAKECAVRVGKFAPRLHATGRDPTESLSRRSSVDELTELRWFRSRLGTPEPGARERVRERA